MGDAVKKFYLVFLHTPLSDSITIFQIKQETTNWFVKSVFLRKPTKFNSNPQISAL